MAGGGAEPGAAASSSRVVGVGALCVLLLAGALVLLALGPSTRAGLTSGAGPPSLRGGRLRPGKRASLLTEVVCKDACCELERRNRSCMYTNLYLNRGVFYAFMPPGRHLDPANLTVLTGIRCAPAVSSYFDIKEKWAGQSRDQGTGCPRSQLFFKRARQRPEPSINENIIGTSIATPGIPGSTSRASTPASFRG